MRFEPSFLAELRKDIESVSCEFNNRAVRPGGLDPLQLLSLVTNTQDVIVPFVDQPRDHDVVDYNNLQLYDHDTGLAAMKRGEVAYVVLAGGDNSMALQRLPELGMTLMAHKLAMSQGLPTYVMVSPNNYDASIKHLNEIFSQAHGCVFTEFEGYRLRPNNVIDFKSPGEPYMHSVGHGCVGDVLKHSTMLHDMPKVKYFIIVNVNNILAAPDPYVLGCHINRGMPVTVEVIDKKKTHQGGCLVWNNGRLEILEEFQVSSDFAAASPFLNTNTMIIDRFVLEGPHDVQWHHRRKVIDNRVSVQYERFLSRYTRDMTLNAIKVPEEFRYFPVKTPEDLLLADKRLNGNRR